MGTTSSLWRPDCVPVRRPSLGTGTGSPRDRFCAQHPRLQTIPMATERMIRPYRLAVGMLAFFAQDLARSTDCRVGRVVVIVISVQWRSQHSDHFGLDKPGFRD